MKRGEYRSGKTGMVYPEVNKPSVYWVEVVQGDEIVWSAEAVN